MLLCFSLVLQASIGLADTGTSGDSGGPGGGDTAMTTDSGDSGGGESPGDDTSSSLDTSSDTAHFVPDSGSSGSACPGAESIKINEFLPNPSGTDADHEWLELYNAGTSSVDLSAWTIEWGTSSYSNSAGLSGWGLDPGDFLLVGGSSVDGVHVVIDLNLGNAGSSSDAVRLVDCLGIPADSVIYGSPNSDDWADDTGTPATSMAPKPNDDQSLERTSDGLDSDACGIDFMVADDPTPGTSNALDPGDTGDTGTIGTCDTSPVLINEIMANPDGTDDGSEWLELFNPGTEDVALAGWIVESGTASYSHADSIDDPIVLPAGGFLVVGGSLSESVDHVMDIYLGNASSGADAVRLVDCTGGVQDTVLYGSGNPEGWLDDDGVVTESIASSPSEGDSLARISDGVDTNQCGEDFADGSPTPGAANGSGGGGCEAGGLSIKINEFLPDPSGADAGQEFVELYNAGTDKVDLSGWGIDTATSSWSSSADYTIPEGTKLGAGKYLVIGGITGADLNDSGQISLGNAGTGPDGLRLLDCTGTVQDTVLYGKSGEVAVDLLLDDAGDQLMAVMPGSDLSAGRVPSGADTDDCSTDFQTDMTPSPGRANGSGTTPEDCVVGSLTVKVNEFLPNPESTDSNREFVELYNAGTETVALAGWGIQSATQAFDTDLDFVFPEGATIAPGAFTVVAGLEVPGADFYLGEGGSFELGNASTAPDGVRLVDCAGTPQDTVLYGDAGDPANDLGLSDDLGAQTMAIMPGEDFAVGRYPDGVDSDNNEVDFFTNMPPSPGSANIRGGSDGTGDGGGCGCGSKEPGTDGPAPSAAFSPAAFLMGLMSLAALRRRED